MLCPKCNKEIAEGMLFCPECGTKVEQAPVVEAPVVETPVAAPAAPVADQPAFQLNLEGTEPEKPKKDPKKKKTIIRITALITALALIITGVLGFVFGDWGAYIGDFFNRMKPAEDYKSDVEQAALNDPDALSEIGALKKYTLAYYEALLNGAEMQYNSADLTMKVMLGDGAKSLLSTLGSMGLDVDKEVLELIQKLDEVEVRLDYSLDKDGILGRMDLGLNGVDLLALDLIMDLKNGEFFMGLPGLTDEYVDIPTDELDADMEMLSQMLYMSRDWVEELPAVEDVEALFDRCVNAAMAEITSVEKSDKELSVGDIKQTVTVLTYELGEEDVIQVALAVLKELEGDETVEALLTGYNAYMEELAKISDEYEDMVIDPEEAMDAITEAINELEDYEPESDEELKIQTYVNKKGQIIGRKVTIPEDMGTISYVTLQEGNKLAFELKVEAEGEEIEFTFEGEKKNDKLSGTGYLDVDGEEQLVIKLKNFNAIEGGNIRIELGKGLQKALKEEMGMAASIISTQIALDITVDQSGMTIWLEMGKEQFLGLSFEYSYGKEDVKIEAPDKVTTDPDAWAAGIDGQAVVDALKKAGISEEMLMSLIGALSESQIL